MKQSEAQHSTVKQSVGRFGAPVQCVMEASGHSGGCLLSMGRTGTLPLLEDEWKQVKRMEIPR